MNGKKREREREGNVREILSNVVIVRIDKKNAVHFDKKLIVCTPLSFNHTNKMKTLSFKCFKCFLSKEVICEVCVFCLI
jgi:uncharacterized protein Veg